MTPQGKGDRLVLSRISHAYSGTPALADISLQMEPGSLTALLGPSGCGKTTLLRIIAGFLRQTSGSVIVGGTPIDDVPAAARNVGIVFQNYALFPHMNVTRNIGYGLRARGIARDRVADRVDEMIRLVKMESFAARFPAELSGGQQQRVALARALAIDPRLVLLDEPFSALDKGLRLDMQIEVKSLLRRTGVTSIIVTHDQEEALSMADRVVVLNQGRMEQEGTPDDLYDRPRNLFVNRFIGHANLVPATAGNHDGTGLDVITRGGSRLRIPSEKTFVVGSAIYVSIRPENLTITEEQAAALPATVRQVLPLGPVDLVEAQLADGTSVKLTRSHTRSRAALVPGQSIALALHDAEACGVFSAGTTESLAQDLSPPLP